MSAQLCPYYSSFAVCWRWRMPLSSSRKKTHQRSFLSHLEPPRIPFSMIQTIGPNLVAGRELSALIIRQQLVHSPGRGCPRVKGANCWPATAYRSWDFTIFSRPRISFDPTPIVTINNLHPKPSRSLILIKFFGVTDVGCPRFPVKK